MFTYSVIYICVTLRILEFVLFIMFERYMQGFVFSVTDLLQVVATRLIQAVRNKLLRACCHQLVNNLMLRADDITLVGTTCCESVGLVNLVPDLSTTGNKQFEHISLTEAVRFLRV